jgi:methionine--tRNA ligase beta chain
MGPFNGTRSQKSGPGPIKGPKGTMATYEDFKKLEIKTARILDVKEHPSADRLYVLDIDIGTEKRQIVAGIKAHYTPEQLKGKNIAVITNLEPAVIRGIESNGMLLAASGNESLSILTLDKDIPPGSKIK